LTSATAIQDNPRSLHKKFVAWLGLLIFFGLLQAVVLLFGLGGKTFETLRGDLFNIPPSFIAAWIIYLVSKQHSDPMKKMWFWLSMALVSLAVADCLWAYLELVLEIDPFPSVADIFYVLQSVAIIVAFWFIPRQRVRTKREGLKFNLEIGIVMTTLVIVAWRFYLADTVLEYGRQYLALGLSLVYPLLDVLQLIMLSLLMFNGRGRLSQLQFTCLAIGLAGLGFYDVLFNIQEASNSYQTGNPSDLLTMVCAVLFSIAAVSSLQTKPDLVSEDTRTEDARVQIRSSWRTLAMITQICIVIVFLINVFRKYDQAINDIGMLIGASLTLVLALFRQSVELRDNSELNKSLRKLSSNLEERVIERTEELNTKTLQLEQSQAKLLATEKLASLGRFTANVAHEVNTPLAASLYDLSHAKKLVHEYKNSILAPNVTKDDHLEIAGELEAIHQRIETSLERLGRFIRRVREQSRMSSKDSSDFDARQILQDCFVHLEYQAFEHHVKLEISLPDEPVLIHGDPLRLGQILNELVFTGIQACAGQSETEKTWVHIALSVGEETIKLSVENNGLAIDRNVLNNVFEPKFGAQGENSNGLGLSVVHDIVKGHFSGDIQVSSRVGFGTRFEILIPKTKSVKENR
jgi:signal transduction histidine kinase